MAHKIFKKTNNEKGISLIELVVAVSIFSLVMIAAYGIFINAIKAQKAMIAKQNVANNLRYVMEFMTKEFRMAQANDTTLDLTFNDGAAVPAKLNSLNSPSAVLSFTNSGGHEIKYSLSGDKILRSNITTAITDQAISSDEVLITGLSFTVNDWDLVAGPSAVSPFITILIKAKARNGVSGEIELQTSISPRIY